MTAYWTMLNPSVYLLRNNLLDFGCNFCSLECLHWNIPNKCNFGRLRLKCDGTRAETRFCLSPKRTSPFKSAGASVQSTTGSRGVGISGSNVGYTMFWGSEGYWLPTPFASFPFTSPPLRHRVPSGFNWTVPHACTTDWYAAMTLTTSVTTSTV